MGEVLKGSGTNSPAKVKVFEVLECNYLAALIYQRTNLSYVGFSAHCLGVQTATILQAMSLFQSRLPKDEDERVILFDDVSFIGEIAARILNKKIKAK